jgi:hypothetical protein
VFRRMLSVIAVPLVLTSCGSEPTSPEPYGPLEFYLRWEGTVTSSVDGSPIEGVWVELFDENADGSPRRKCGLSCPSERTDSAGFYSIRYVCTVDAPDPTFIQVCSRSVPATCDGWQESGADQRIRIGSRIRSRVPEPQDVRLRDALDPD